VTDLVIPALKDPFAQGATVFDGNVLVVDDDVAHAKSLVDLLSASGIQADAIHNGADGLAAVLANPPNVLLLDLNMPGTNGLEVLAELNQHTLITKTIVLTGETSLSTISPVVRLGACEYLAKPPDTKALLASVRQALQLSAAEQQASQMANAADHANRLHKFLVDAIPDLIYMLDDNGDISFINNKLGDIFGFAPQELQGQPWTELFSKSHNSELASAFRNRFNERRTDLRATQQYEFDFNASNGNQHRLEFSATGMYDGPGGKYSGTYGVMRDITAKFLAQQEHLDLQAQIQQASKMEAIGQLAGGIAHDFNNILASIIGFAELVMNMRQRMKEPEINEYLGEVVSAGHRARDLISQMLTFTRARRGDPEPVQLVGTITDVSRMLRAAIPTSIEIITDYQEALPRVVADPVQLQQIVLNLLINARDAISGNGVIEITARLGQQAERCATCGELLDDDHVVLSVSDTGHGIPKDVAAKIFEMYYTTRAPGEGTGIGLWLINDLVHEYGGHLTVDSALGEGTTFAIHLPGAPGDDNLDASPANRKANILGPIVVIDDEVSVSNFIGEVLRDTGYEVVIYNDSTLALSFITEQIDKVGMVITDQHMPRMTGIELATRVKSISPDVPIIMVTGYAAETSREDMQQAGINGFLAKPFRIEELLAAISRHAPARLN
jgi:PAS domain S-box-containing protein